VTEGFEAGAAAFHGDAAAPVLEELLRREHGRVLGGLVRRLGDLDLAEDVLQEALVEAWQRWPLDGVPDNPAAWLTTVARNRAYDRIRRERLRLPKEAEALGLREGGDEPLTPGPADLDDVDAPLADDQLALLLLACHPALPVAAQQALTLRSVAGLTTPEIAAAFLVPEATMAQRIVRAKRKITLARIPFRLPEGVELTERLAVVAHVVYLVFNEGYAATAGDVPIRRELCAEALRLGRLLVALAPDDHEAWGLLALMLLQDSRRGARVDDFGRLVPLGEQDRSRWDQRQIAEGRELVKAALSDGFAGPYQIQAAIAAVHSESLSDAETDWQQIRLLYRMLELVAPGPLVTLNRAVAVARCDGPEAGLAVVDGLLERAELVDHHRLASVRGHLLEDAGRRSEAMAEYVRAAELTSAPAERTYLLARAARLHSDGSDHRGDVVRGG
jgi:RNA polymerase sigma factor (sigma-70 family)